MEDVIPVRVDEKFDESKLTVYLANHLPDANSKRLAVAQFGGGAANLTYQLSYPETQYVLRRPPLGKVAKSSHDMTREFKVLSVLHQEFPPAPKAFHLCEDESIIGAPFFVMERKNGIVIRKTFPEELQDIPNIASDISKNLVDTLVKFHKVDYEKIGLANLGKPKGFIHRQIEGWYNRWNHSKIKDLEEMNKVYTWLLKNEPEDYSFSLVHNDYKLDNVMLAESNPSEIIAVFDWDMTTLGTPFSDLGSLLTYWTEQDDEPYFRSTSMMPIDDIGFWTRDQLIQRYAQKSGLSINDITFYHVLGLFRLTVIIAQIYIRFHRGQTKDQRFAAFGSLIPLIAKKAYLLMD